MKKVHSSWLEIETQGYNRKKKGYAKHALVW